MDIFLPPIIVTILSPFLQMFSAPTWKKAKILCVGAILCQGAHRITSILRIMGLSQERRFEQYHRFLNRDKWDPLLGAKILLGLLVVHLLPPGWPLLFILDDTIERRRGKKIKAKGCYRDAVRSTNQHVITCFGLKWLPICLLLPLPWSNRPWALPFLVFLQHPKKYNEERKHKHRTSIDYAKIGIHFISHWLPKKLWTLLGDGGFACLELIEACIKRGGNLIARLRLDSRLYAFPIPQVSGKRGRKPIKGKRIPSFKSMLINETQEWTDLEVNWYGGKKKSIQYVSGINLMYKPNHKPVPIRWVLLRDREGKIQPAPIFSSHIQQDVQSIIEQFVYRFSIEVTFEEVRAHLGVETQRQWSDKAIARSTPLLMGLFSLICLIAYMLKDTVHFFPRSASWYPKNPDEATFSDIIAYVRRYCWASKYFVNSQKNDDMIKLNVLDFETIVSQLAYSP